MIPQVNLFLFVFWKNLKTSIAMHRGRQLCIFEGGQINFIELCGPLNARKLEGYQMVSTEEPYVQAAVGFFVNLVKVSSKSVPKLLADLADAAM